MTDINDVKPMPEVDPKLLQEAFESFMATSKLMEKAYHELQAKVEQLNLELEEKNKELAAQLEATEHARAQVSDVLASLHLAVVVFDAEGKLARINRAGQELFGVREEAAIGLGLVEVFAIKFNGITGLPTWSDSAGLMAEFEVGSLDDPPGRVLRCSTHRMRGMDGGEGRILLAEDITDAVVKRAAAARHQRLAAMGELAVQIVHQIRNPMGSIELFASMLQRDLATQPEMADVAGKVQQGIRSLNLIVSNLLSFAKGAEPVVQLIDFRHLLESAVAEIDVQLLQNNISMATEIDPEATFISVDPDLWRQVMLNLMINATQAMAGGGELNVQTRRSQNGGGLPVTQVIIGDTGSGIPSGIREQVFNPFFTTKERGAGVGLALVHNIVRAHGGSIEFDSVEGGGTTFTITLPG